MKSVGEIKFKIKVSLIIILLLILCSHRADWLIDWYLLLFQQLHV